MGNHINRENQRMETRIAKVKTTMGTLVGKTDQRMESWNVETKERVESLIIKAKNALVEYDIDWEKELMVKLIRFIASTIKVSYHERSHQVNRYSRLNQQTRNLMAIKAGRGHEKKSRWSRKTLVEYCWVIEIKFLTKLRICTSNQNLLNLNLLALSHDTSYKNWVVIIATSSIEKCHQFWARLGKN